MKLVKWRMLTLLKPINIVALLILFSFIYVYQSFVMTTLPANEQTFAFALLHKLSAAYVMLPMLSIVVAYFYNTSHRNAIVVTYRRVIWLDLILYSQLMTVILLVMHIVAILLTIGTFQLTYLDWIVIAMVWLSHSTVAFLTMLVFVITKRKYVAVLVINMAVLCDFLLLQNDKGTLLLVDVQIMSSLSIMQVLLRIFGLLILCAIIYSVTIDEEVVECLQ